MKPRSTRLFYLFLVSAICWLSWANPAASLTVQQGDYWYLISPLESPSALAFHGLAYDANRQVTVLFGGNDDAFRVNKTWEYDGVNWSETSPIPSPSGRENITHAMAFDAMRDKIVLFGGLSVSGYVNDTWEYDGAAWSQVNTATRPIARDAHTLVYDSQRGKIVLFGGAHPANNYLSDTWEYDGSDWQQSSPAQSPPGRNHHAAAYDSRRGVMVVFGGIGQGGVYLNDTWEYDGSNWRRVYPSFSPTARSNHSMTYDYERGVAVLFGGTENGDDPIQDTWEFDGTNWRLVVPNEAPPARIGTSLAYDSARQRVVMYGGGYFNGGNLNVLGDTWEYEGGTAFNLPIVVEARLDIGMPFNLDRGCLSPYEGCGGAFHGFFSGVGSDLVMDAYRAGASFDIQTELSQDHKAHPGRYRFGTARQVEDLRRYFSFKQLFYPHNDPYLPGDIAFFDWDEDGLSDHAGIVAEIDAQARPIKIVSATGFTEENPPGQARELDWNGDFEQYSSGHARLNDTGYTPVITTTETVQTLRIRLDTFALSLELMDKYGKVTAADYQENLVASNVDEYIPYIPGSVYINLGTQQVITATNPLENTDDYLIELTAQQDQTYHLYVETLLDGTITDSRVYTQTVSLGETRRVAITLQSQPGFKIKSASAAPLPSPQLSYPAMLDLSGLVGTTIQHNFNLQEVGGFVLADRVEFTASDLYNQLGEKIAFGQLTVTPNRFDLPAGAAQEVTLEVNLVGAKPGLYQGSLTLRATNTNPVTIPLTVVVEPYERFIPLVNR